MDLDKEWRRSFPHRASGYADRGTHRFDSDGKDQSQERGGPGRRAGKRAPYDCRFADKRQVLAAPAESPPGVLGSNALTFLQSVPNRGLGLRIAVVDSDFGGGRPDRQAPSRHYSLSIRF